MKYNKTKYNMVYLDWKPLELVCQLPVSLGTLYRPNQVIFVYYSKDMLTAYHHRALGELAVLAFL